MMALLVAAMVGLAFASAPLYRTFCAADGLRRDAAARREGAGRRRRPGQRPLRRQYPSRPAVAVRARADDGRRQARARRPRSSTARRTSARDDGPAQAAFNVSPDQVGKYFKKIAVLLLHRADAESRARRSTCRWCFSSIPRSSKDPDTKDIDEITLELYILPGGNRHSGPLEPPIKANEGSRTNGRYEEPRLPSGRSRSLAADRRDLRRPAVQRRWSCGGTTIPTASSSSRSASLGVLVTMYNWWSNTIREAHTGYHTPVVQLHLRYGMILFIASEVMFFLAWFWAFFDSSLFPSAVDAVGGAVAAQGHRSPRIRGASRCSTP